MIQGLLLRDALISAANVLNDKKQDVDALNIFPVPDGDTGTNMSMTVSAAGRELARMDNPNASEVADTAASAMLRGARGNSGVITSLLFRGFSKGLKGREEATGYDLAYALGLGVEAAYKAVMKPTEGTILTVAREAAEAGRVAAEEDDDPIRIWKIICDEADASLARTPDLLPVLKKAGVVDAGGQGFCIVIRAMLDVFEGGEVVKGSTSVAAAKKNTSAAGSFETDIKFTYCTEFIVARENKKDPIKLRAYLESIGDCVVVVDDDEIVKVHVHTNDPGQVLHKAIEYGSFEMVKVENMRIQHENAGWVEEADPEQKTEPALEAVEASEPYSFVSVAAGDGIKALFEELGCAQVVSGGQTMNPSTEDILQAIEATPGKVVYVFPNNKNIILAAEQTIPLTDREVHVVPTRSVPQGVSAILAFNPDVEVEDNLVEMRHAADEISTGSLTFAARDSDYEDRDIKEGQILAMDNGKLSCVEDDIEKALVKLIKNMIGKRKQEGKESCYLTLMYGADVTEEQATAAEAAIREKLGEDLEVTVIDGGQPVYYYILSIE